VGALLTGVFAAAAFGGAGLAEGVTIGSQLMVQAEAVLATIVYDAVVTYVLLKLIDWVIGLRVSHDEEREGLDITQHGEQVYE